MYLEPGRPPLGRRVDPQGRRALVARRLDRGGVGGAMVDRRLGRGWGAGVGAPVGVGVGGRVCRCTPGARLPGRSETWSASRGAARARCSSTIARSSGFRNGAAARVRSSRHARISNGMRRRCWTFCRSTTRTRSELAGGLRDVAVGVGALSLPVSELGGVRDRLVRHLPRDRGGPEGHRPGSAAGGCGEPPAGCRTSVRAIGWMVARGGSSDPPTSSVCPRRSSSTPLPRPMQLRRGPVLRLPPHCADASGGGKGFHLGCKGREVVVQWRESGVKWRERE